LICRRQVALALCALGLTAAGVSPALAGAAASGPSRTHLASRIHWQRCGDRLDCARVHAPLDWQRPGGPKITLAVIRHVASRPHRRIGSLLVNGGGATGSVELVRSEGARLDRLGQGRFDVVGWALRGGAGAEPMVRCFANQRSRDRFWDGLSIPTTRAQSLAYLPKTVAYARRCGTLGGRLLAHVSTTDDARDLDYLRRLLGDRQLSYWAVSYGTFLGETYANMFPRRVRAMALDGLVDPRLVVRGAAARFSNTIAAMDRGLRAFESVCQRAGSARCALAGRGAVAPRVAGLLARLRRGPTPAPTASPPGALSYGDLSAALFATLTNPGAWPQLARDLERAARGDGSALATLARAVLAGTRSAAGDPPTAITCTDSPARKGPGDWPQVIAWLTRVSQVGGPGMPVPRTRSWSSAQCLIPPLRIPTRGESLISSGTPSCSPTTATGTPAKRTPAAASSERPVLTSSTSSPHRREPCADQIASRSIVILASHVPSRQGRD
jgi:pimeloyl-ACP methyl ester carboxylesterase